MRGWGGGGRLAVTLDGALLPVIYDTGSCCFVARRTKYSAASLRFIFIFPCPLFYLVQAKERVPFSLIPPFPSLVYYLNNGFFCIGVRREGHVADELPEEQAGRGSRQVPAHRRESGPAAQRHSQPECRHQGGHSRERRRTGACLRVLCVCLGVSNCT